MIDKAILFFAFATVLFFASNTVTSGQSISLNATFRGTPLELEKPFSLGEFDGSLTIRKIKFYLSDLRVFQERDKMVHQKIAPQLMDLSSPEKIKLPVTVSAFDRIDFLLGVDSATNHSGAMDGDLDPLAGMYWTWQSGYINVKIEGVLKLKDSSDIDLICHLGGFRKPFISAQKISLLSMNFQKEININLELDDFISEVIKRKKYHVMSPCKDAVDYSEIIAHSFKFQ